MKVLAAVQSAAQDEMAFEQRAAVAKNLENFVLGHQASFKFQVSSFKLIRRLRSFSQIIFMDPFVFKICAIREICG